MSLKKKGFWNAVLDFSQMFMWASQTSEIYLYYGQTHHWWSHVQHTFEIMLPGNQRFTARLNKKHLMVIMSRFMKYEKDHLYILRSAMNDFSLTAVLLMAGLMYILGQAVCGFPTCLTHCAKIISGNELWRFMINISKVSRPILYVTTWQYWYKNLIGWISHNLSRTYQAHVLHQNQRKKENTTPIFSSLHYDFLYILWPQA